jgi:hypothetical protein
MLGTNLQLSVKSLYNNCTTLQLGYIDFLSLSYPLPKETLDEYRYTWNYNLLCLNESIDLTLRSILNSIQTEFYPDNYAGRQKGDFKLEYIKDTIDCVFKLWRIFEDKDYRKLAEVFQELPVDHLLRLQDGRNFSELLAVLFTDLIDKELLILSNQDLFLLQDMYKDLQQYLPFDEAFIISHNDILDWGKLSSNEHILWSNRLLSRFKDKINWKKLSQNYPFTKEQLMRYSDFISWSEIIHNHKISWDLGSFVNDFYDKIDSYDLEKILERLTNNYEALFSSGLVYFIKERAYTKYLISFQTEHKIDSKFDIWHYVDWPYFCFSPPSNISDHQLWKFKLPSLQNEQNRNWHPSKIRVNRNKVNWESLLNISSLVQRWKLDSTFRVPEKEFGRTVNYDDLDPNYMSFIDRLNWRQLSINKDIPWSLGILEIFEKRWDWEWISYNSSIPFNNEILRKFSERIDWDLLSELDSGFWNEDIIDEFSHLLNWEKLSANQSLPWSAILIRRFEHRWNWIKLSSNEGLPWSIFLFFAFKDNWVFAAQLKISFLAHDETYNKIFVSGLAGNISFYKNLLLPLGDNQIEAWLTKQTQQKRAPGTHLLPDLSPCRKYFRLNQPFDFGKYKGKTLQEIIDVNIAYAIWAISKVIVSTDQEAIDYIVKSIYCLDGMLEYCPNLDIYKNNHRPYLEDYGLSCCLEYEEEDNDRDDDYDHSFRDYGYDSWDDMNLDAGFDGDIDAWNHYNE